MFSRQEFPLSCENIYLLIPEEYFVRNRQQSHILQNSRAHSLHVPTHCTYAVYNYTNNIYLICTHSLYLCSVQLYKQYLLYMYQLIVPVQCTIIRTISTLHVPTHCPCTVYNYTNNIYLTCTHSLYLCSVQLYKQYLLYMYQLIVPVQCTIIRTISTLHVPTDCTNMLCTNIHTIPTLHTMYMINNNKKIINNNNKK